MTKTLNQTEITKIIKIIKEKNQKAIIDNKYISKLSKNDKDTIYINSNVLTDITINLDGTDEFNNISYEDYSTIIFYEYDKASIINRNVIANIIINKLYNKSVILFMDFNETDIYDKYDSAFINKFMLIK